MSLSPSTEKSFRKVILSKFTSMRGKKNMKKVLCTVPGSSHKGFSINIKVYTYVVKVQWVSLLLNRFFASKCLFYFKKGKFSFSLIRLSRGPSPLAVQYSLTASFLTEVWARAPDGSPYSSTRGVPLGVAPVFLGNRLWAFRDFTIFILTSKTSWMAFRKQWKL